MLNRRDFIRRLVGGGVGIALAPSVLLSVNPYDVDIAMSFAGYSPTWYANESLELLRRTLTFTHHLYRNDHVPIGDTITIRIPERFR